MLTNPSTRAAAISGALCGPRHTRCGIRLRAAARPTHMDSSLPSCPQCDSNRLVADLGPEQDVRVMLCVRCDVEWDVKAG